MMAWTEEQEAAYRKRLADQWKRDVEIDEEKKREVRLGISPACPQCGSHRFVDGTKVESCSDCGYAVSYWSG
jgi:uncharacterized protein (DUF983 family)